jgi:arsenite methyltransferase
MAMHDIVQRYYGETLRSTQDLQSTACCTDAELPEYLKPILSELHEEVLARYYGCGLIIPEHLEGLTVLDLGCGAGRDAYALSRLVGAQGRVIGVDMTPAQLEVARRHVEFHRQRFGYPRSNVEFREGLIERLGEIGIPDDSVDVIVSNCVVNLSPDKDAVLTEAHRTLMPGGEFYFADVYADRRVPSHLRSDPLLYGECLSGALYWNDFLNLARQHGFSDPRLVGDRPIHIENPAMVEKVGAVRFYSATYRLFKLDALEPACEDYGQAVVYLGTIPRHPDRFVLDKHHRIETGRVFPVCGNTWRMLKETRFAPHFQFIGDFSRHYGLFAGCGGGLPFDSDSGTAGSAAGCC